MAVKPSKGTNSKATVTKKSPKAKRAKQTPERTVLYTKYFSPDFVDPNELIQQVNGFGTPVYSQTRYIAGV